MSYYEPTPRRPAPVTPVRAVLMTLLLLGVLWVLEVIDYVSGTDVGGSYLGGSGLDGYGIVARDIDGLPNIFTAPFLHYGFDHLIGNTVPLAVLGFFSALRGLSRFIGVSLIIIVVSGLGVWFTAPPNSITLGASGLVLGYFGYLLARGVLERRAVDLIVAVIVLFLYGTLFTAVLPGQPGISWQGHLFGLIGGVIAAWALRTRRATTPRQPRDRRREHPEFDSLGNPIAEDPRSDPYGPYGAAQGYGRYGQPGPYGPGPNYGGGPTGPGHYGGGPYR